MGKLNITTQPNFEETFNRYPEKVNRKMMQLNNLILEAAEELEHITQLERTLKWGEPSYAPKYGSTFRIDWKAKTPEQYAMYFQSKSRLVKTFKILFKHQFKFEENRAIIFHLREELSYQEELKYCIKAALQYHQVKHLPNLGI